MEKKKRKRKKRPERSICVSGPLYWELDAFIKEHGGSKRSHVDAALRYYLDRFRQSDEKPVQPVSLMDTVAADEEVETWNSRHKVGTRVEYQGGQISWTTAPAEVSGGVACVPVRGVARMVPLKKIQVIADRLVRKDPEELPPKEAKVVDGAGVREF